MQSRFPATDALADEIEGDLRANPGAVAIICCLDEESAPGCAEWVDQQKDRLLVLNREFTRGVIRFPAGQYRLHKGAVFHWPDDGPPLIAPLVYVPVNEPTEKDAINLADVLYARVPPSPKSVWFWWLDDDAQVDDAGW